MLSNYIHAFDIPTFQPPLDWANLTSSDTTNTLLPLMLTRDSCSLVTFVMTTQMSQKHVILNMRYYIYAFDTPTFQPPLE